MVHKWGIHTDSIDQLIKGEGNLHVKRGRQEGAWASQHGHDHSEEAPRGKGTSRAVFSEADGRGRGSEGGGGC